MDLSLLVDARSRATIPVSCVEHGRWDGSRHAERFAPSPDVPHPWLRSRKRAHVNASVAAGLAARADQAAVWAAVRTDLDEQDVVSTTDSLHDLYDAKRDELRDLGAEMEPAPGQVGSLAAVSGRPIALDAVSRADVFAGLLPRLAQGYALDALGAAAADPDAAAAESFLERALAARRADHASTPGLGTGFGLSGDDLVGGGLAVEDEVIALSAFPGDGPVDPHGSERHGVIARPSRRRLDRS